MKFSQIKEFKKKIARLDISNPLNQLKMFY